MVVSPDGIPTSEDSEYEVSYRGDGQLGVVQIADGVIARIAATAASEIEGVSLVGRSGLAELLGRGDPVKGVKVETAEGNRCSINLEVQMAYKTSMSELAFKLQRHVKDVVERMTGRPVDSVNVLIVGLFSQKAGAE